MFKLADYTALNRALQNTVEKHTPDVLYPRYCKITNINQNSIDVLTVIGGDVNLYDLDYIGNPIIGNEGILIPTNNNFNTSIVICKDSKVINGENVKINSIDNKYLNNITSEFENNISEIENNINEYNTLLEEYKNNVEELKAIIKEAMLEDKKELLDEIEQKADKEHTHTFRDVYNDVNEIEYIDIEDY